MIEKEGRMCECIYIRKRTYIIYKTIYSHVVLDMILLCEAITKYTQESRMKTGDELRIQSIIFRVTKDEKKAIKNNAKKANAVGKHLRFHVL